MKFRVRIVLMLLTGTLFSCKQQPFTVEKVTSSPQKIDASIADDKEVDDFIAPFRKHLNETLDAPLSVATKNLTKGDGELESTLGNLVADISLEQTTSIFTKRHNKNIDLVLLNHGGLRAPILKGNVTARTAFEVMPFENELVVAELTSEKTKELISYLTARLRAHPISNLELSINKETKQAEKILIDGKPLEEGRTYLVLTTDYLQQGGDRMDFFKDPVHLYKTDYKLRNALIDYFKKTDTLHVSLDKRMSYAK